MGSAQLCLVEQGEWKRGVKDTGSEVGGLGCHPIPATVLGKALGTRGAVFPLKQ